jgi:malonyl CoA-acyl carrier protein transacylase
LNMTRFAFVFPGQGSQSRGMMNGYADFAAVRDTFAEASEVLQQDLWQLVAEGTDEALSATINTQPVMLTAGVAVYRAWQSQGGAKPIVMAGHSLGEYTALVAAGALRFADALPLVRYRARCMQQAVPEGVGGIAAILGLDDDAVRAVCSEGAQGEVLEAVNYNSPGQVVIAGNRAAVERGMELAKARGAKRAIMLPMSVPSHCVLLKGAVAVARLSGQCPGASSGHSRAAQCRRQELFGSCGNQGRNGAPAVSAGALGRNCSRIRQDGRYPQRRMCAGQGIGRIEQTYRFQSASIIHSRRRSPEIGAGCIRIGNPT